MTMTKAARLEQDEERAEALKTLREWLQPGDTVRTILRHVSRSGMQRAISLVATVDNEPFDITWLAARAMRDRIDQNHGGIVVGGCGMDMGFHLVYNLSRTLFPDGYACTGESCPGNDHSNPPHPARVAGSMTHGDGGYALRQRWL